MGFKKIAGFLFIGIFLTSVVFFCLHFFSIDKKQKSTKVKWPEKVDVPEYSFIKDDFIKAEDFDLAGDGYLCVRSLAEFQQLIKNNSSKLIYRSEVEASQVQNFGFLHEVFWKEYPEYYWFHPMVDANALRCNYFESKAILNLSRVGGGEKYELGRFNQPLTKDSFSQLVDFLIRAKFVPVVPLGGFNFSIKDYSSIIEETETEIIRTDYVKYVVIDDVSDHSSTGEETHRYLIRKIDGVVFYQEQGQTPYYPFN